MHQLSLNSWCGLDCGGCSGNLCKDAAKRLLRVELLRQIIRRPRDRLREGDEDFQSLNGVDAEVRLDAQVQSEHIGRIARAFGNELQQCRFPVAARDRCCNRWHCFRSLRFRSCGGRSACDGSSLRQHTTQCLLRVELFRKIVRRTWDRLRERNQDFQSLDRVNAEIRFNAQVHAEHLGRIARALGDEFEKSRFAVAARNRCRYCRRCRRSLRLRSCGGRSACHGRGFCQHTTQRLLGVQLFRKIIRRAGNRLRERNQDFKALDRIDAEIRFDA